MNTWLDSLFDRFDRVGRDDEGGEGWPIRRKDLVVVVGVFLAVNLVLAWVLQLRSGDPPNTPGGSVDQFDSFILWGASLLALLVALAQRGSRRARLVWLGACVAFALLAIDEVFEFHEETKAAAGDDDYIKIVMWFSTGVAVYLLWYVGRLRGMALRAFLCAAAVQFVWLTSDMGDGDFFRIPLPLGALHWIEEYCELVASSLFLIGTLLHLVDRMIERASSSATVRAGEVVVLADAETLDLTERQRERSAPRSDSTSLSR